MRQSLIIQGEIIIITILNTFKTKNTKTFKSSILPFKGKLLMVVTHFFLGGIKYTCAKYAQITLLNTRSIVNLLLLPPKC